MLGSTAMPSITVLADRSAPPIASDYLSPEFLKRVRLSYKLAIDATAQTRGGKIWNTIDARRAVVHDALIDKDDDKLRAIFANPVSTDLFLGVDYLCHSIIGQLPPIGKPAQWAIPSLSNLGGGALDAFDQQTVTDHFRNNASKDFSILARAIGLASNNQETALLDLDKVLRQHVLFPNFPAELGLASTRGTITDRAIQALYYTSLASTLLADCSDKSIVEIGPGIGRIAYYSYLSGVTDYTTIDLPMGMVAQACFLGMALGPDKIWLPSDNPNLADGRIKLLVGQLPSRNYGLAINTDSLTEMNFKTAVAYVRWIKQHCQLFFCVNHDTNWFEVEPLAKKWFEIAISRPFPLRPSFVEAIYRPRVTALLSMPWHKIAGHAAKIFARRAGGYVRRRVIRLRARAGYHSPVRARP
jgi:hypothetical protein